MRAGNGNWRLLGVALLTGAGISLAGCGDKTNGGTAEKTDPKPAVQNEPAKTQPEKPAETPVAPVATQNKEPAPTEPAKPVVVQNRQVEPAVDTKPKRTQPANPEEARQQMTDAVFAQIRLQMEQAIVERKELLDGGAAPSDERVRTLEGRIMKARSLLQDNGEEVEDVDPPIVLPG